MGKRIVPAVVALAVASIAVLAAASASTALSSTDTVVLGARVPETALSCPGGLKHALTVDYDPAGRETRTAEQVAADAAAQLVPGAADGTVTGEVAYRAVASGKDTARQVVYRDGSRIVALIALKDHGDGGGLRLDHVVACAPGGGQKPDPAAAFGVSCGGTQPEITPISEAVDGDLATALKDANTVANVPQPVRDAVGMGQFTTTGSSRGKQQVKVRGDSGDVIAVYTLVKHPTNGLLIEAVAHCR